jgi:protein transport protein SEC61 subunit gamma-like protein
MSDQVQEILDLPREFFRDGLQFVNRCQKRE